MMQLFTQRRLTMALVALVTFMGVGPSTALGAETKIDNLGPQGLSQALKDKGLDYRLAAQVVHENGESVKGRETRRLKQSDVLTLPDGATVDEAKWRRMVIDENRTFGRLKRCSSRSRVRSGAATPGASTPAPVRAVGVDMSTVPTEANAKAFREGGIVIDGPATLSREPGEWATFLVYERMPNDNGTYPIGEDSVSNQGLLDERHAIYTSETFKLSMQAGSAIGTYTFTVKGTRDPAHTATITLIVVEPPVLDDLKIKFADDKDSVDLEPNKSSVVQVFGVTTANAAVVTAVTVSSSDPKVATATHKDGEVTIVAVAPGEAQILLAATRMPYLHKYVDVHVAGAQAAPTAPAPAPQGSAIVFSKTNVEVSVGGTVNLNVTVQFPDGTMKPDGIELAGATPSGIIKSTVNKKGILTITGLQSGPTDLKVKGPGGATALLHVVVSSTPETSGPADRNGQPIQQVLNHGSASTGLLLSLFFLIGGPRLSASKGSTLVRSRCVAPFQITRMSRIILAVLSSAPVVMILIT